MPQVSAANTSSFPLWDHAFVQKKVLSMELFALYLSKPLHITSEFFIRATFTPISQKDESYLVQLVSRVFIVIFSVATAPTTIGLALAGAAIFKLADLIKDQPFTYIEGKGEEKLSSKASTKALTLNACSLWGGLPIPLGGMRPSRERIAALAELIKEKQPDVLVMQEMAFDPAMNLISCLSERFAHFYTRIGPNPPLMESGLFVATTLAVQDTGFIQFPNQLGINRGAFWIETADSVFFTTHMEFGHDEKAADQRQLQLGLIKDKIKYFEGKRKTCFLLGDFNLDRAHGNQHYEQMKIGKDFHDPYYQKHRNIDEKSATCTDVICAEVLGKAPPKRKFEMVDYALQSKGASKRGLGVELCATYDVEKPKEALSDHRGLLLKISS